ncbi:hypothetical protein H2200_004889 [Cladophialophora chaetospira]|uniref:Uncharacterized protein n=1 Tax=Cladophialophora chaetospira TaxID=386627 RepID=A0AA39CKK9_9EURO|nr:hypothetical protein H2200_004889 [Cladophialophora chaetospira]
MESLEKDLGSLGRILSDTRDMIKTQLELEQVSFTWVLTLLAAIYLPFTFTAGLFGMNVKDPLWPKSQSHVPHKSTTSPKKFDIRPEMTSIAIQAPNFITTVIHAITTSTAPTQATASSNLTASLEEALSSQPGSYLFDFKQFWYIAVSVTAATIFLPLVVGPAFRSTVRLSYNHREIWKALVFVIFFSGTITLSILEGYWASYILGSLQALCASYMLINKSWKPTESPHIYQWIVYTAIVVGFMLYDIFGYIYGEHTSLLGQTPSEYDFFWWSASASPSTVGLLGPIWLFGLWIWGDRPILSETRINQFITQDPEHHASLRRFLEAFLRAVNYLKQDDGPRRNIRSGLSIFALGTACGINAALCVRLPFTMYLGLTFTFFGLHGLYQLRMVLARRRRLSARSTKDETNCLFFLLVVGTADAVELTSDFGHLVGASALLPLLALMVIQSERLVASAYGALRRRFHRRRRAAIASDPGRQVSPAPLQV